MQFTHQPMRLQRTFVIQDQSTCQTKVLTLEVVTFAGQIDLFPVFSYALEDLSNAHIKIYDFRVNKYVDISTLGIRFHVPIHIFDTGNNVVLIKYKSNNSENIKAETMSVQSMNSSIKDHTKSQTASKKTQRSKERIILEVIQIVKKWRKICENKKGITMTLAESANHIGLPKKSLDDYYYQLRMGQKYGFDYHAHIMERIGTLRSFLKKYKTHRKDAKNQKLPNVLKIADEIDGYDNLVKQPQQYSYQIQEEVEEQKQQAQQSPGIKKQTIEKDFYNEFNYNFGRQLDPFLTLGKSPMGDQSNMSNEFEMFF